MSDNIYWNVFDENGNYVSIEDANKGEQYYCPVCNGRLICRKGKIRAWHFAHVAGECKDTWKYDMSDWHLSWQKRFPKECREITISNNNKRHRADVLVGKTVIEFQHSPMSYDEFQERNQFYTGAGYNLVWLFDVKDDYENDRISTNDNNANIWIWKFPKQTFFNFNPKEHKDIAIFFEIAEKDYIHVTRFDNASNKTFYTDTMEFLYIPDIAKNIELNISDLCEKLYMADKMDMNANIFNCPKGKAVYEDCWSCKSYTQYGTKDVCTKKFESIIQGFNSETDKVVYMDGNKDGIIRKVVVQKAGKEETYTYSEPSIGKTLFNLILTTESAVIVARNLRTGSKVKIGTRFYKNTRSKDIEGYFMKAPYEFYKVKNKVYYAEKPEWVITWESPERA